jgi:hypothetical protein
VRDAARAAAGDSAHACACLRKIACRIIPFFLQRFLNNLNDAPVVMLPNISRCCRKSRAPAFGGATAAKASARGRRAWGRLPAAGMLGPSPVRQPKHALRIHRKKIVLPTCHLLLRADYFVLRGTGGMAA